MSYDLNKKRIFKVIGIDLFLLAIIGLIDYLIIISTNLEKVELTAQLLMLGIPIIILFTGILGILAVIYLNIRILTYKNKDILTVTDKSITYNTYIFKNIVIRKEDIDRMYCTFHNDEYLIRNKYIAVVTKEPIEQLRNKKGSIFRIKSFEHCLYINVSELNQNPEKIAFEIENKLGIPIKKKEKNLYFGKNIYIVDKL